MKKVEASLGRCKESKTTHFGQRTAQRGITHDMVALVLQHGRIKGDKYQMSRDAAKAMLLNIQRVRHQLMTTKVPVPASSLVLME